METNDIMIVPDVHGRTFWKEAKDFNGKIIFLGDYVDPYVHYEPVTYKGALANFKEVINFAKEDKNVILLVGNHDMTYFFDPCVCECRTDWDNFQEIRNLFRDNADLFKLAHYENYDGHDVIFTHACLHDDWITNAGCPYEEAEYRVNWLNLEFERMVSIGYDHRDAFLRKLATVSYERGGCGSFGSVVWADIRECQGFLKDPTKPINIFGHTQLNEDGTVVNLGNCFCIDSRKCFSLNDLINRYETTNETKVDE